MEFWNQTMAWYIAGPLIALVMFLLTFMGHSFGVSANLRTACSILGLGNKIKFFDFDWKKQRWNLIFILGALIGGFISDFELGPTSHNVESPQAHQISENSQEKLKEMSFHFQSQDLLPEEFSSDGLSVGSVLMLLLGGVLIGFGARYGGGCTSGHAISGLSNLQLPSLIAVVGFFIGGLLMSHFLLKPLSAIFL